MALKLSRLRRLNGIQWLWVQISLRPTFFSYFRESFIGDIDDIYMYLYLNLKPQKLEMCVD